jgi:hypothetical protein
VRTIPFSRYAVSLSTTALLLASCSGSQPPIGAAGAIPESSNLHSVMPLQHLASSGDEVQFVTQDYPPRIAEFDYSKGDAPIRSWRLKSGTYPEGACSAGTQTFWVVLAKADEIAEYGADGEKPIKTLTVTGPPSNCTIDPTTGDLAVALAGTSNVVIFTKGSGSGQIISDKLDHSAFSTFDAKGNLFVDGHVGSEPKLAELPKKGAQFKLLSFSPKLYGGLVGYLQWDGTYLAMHVSNELYRYRASGGVARLEGELGIGAECQGFWFWTQAGLLFCPIWGYLGYVRVYDYPAGNQIAELGPISLYQSSIVSLKP